MFETNVLYKLVLELVTDPFHLHLLGHLWSGSNGHVRYGSDMDGSAPVTPKIPANGTSGSSELGAGGFLVGLREQVGLMRLHLFVLMSWCEEPVCFWSDVSQAAADG